jgi:hypothetical protein
MSVNFAGILECLMASTGITSIAAIGSLDSAEVWRGNPRLRHTDFTDRPWSFLEGINVFVGGDGVMVAEAVSRYLPTFSVTSRNRMEKNRLFFESETMDSVILDDFVCESLQQQVTNRERLTRLHYAARKFVRPGADRALATAIERIHDGHC